MISYTSAIAAQQLKRVFPHSTPLPWRGNDGASADVVTLNYGVVRVSLRKGGGSWWAEASGGQQFKTIEQLASSAAEAADKIKAELLKLTEEWT